jgi:hypothetical protein
VEEQRHSTVRTADGDVEEAPVGRPEQGHPSILLRSRTGTEERAAQRGWPTMDARRGTVSRRSAGTTK